jgi:hypothetical protein
MCGNAHPTVDCSGKDETFVVVRVLADQVDSAWRPHHQRWLRLEFILKRAD